MCLLLFVQILIAQESKLRIAVFDPTISGKSFDEGTGVIVREMVSTSIVETGKYIIIERSLIDKILKEQKFSNSGAVNESQVSELGKLAGADKVILCVLSSYSEKGMLSLKMIDVESANIENQKSKLVGQMDILDIITPLTFDLIGIEQPKILSKTTKDKKKEDKEDNVFKAGINTVLGGLKSQKEKFAESMNKEESTDFTVSSSKKSPEGTEISIIFAGVKNGKNPDAKIYIDDKFIGGGTLNGGFSINFNDNSPGEHQIRVEWSGVVSSKSFKVNTRTKNRVVFDYTKGGFGYEFKISN